MTPAALWAELRRRKIELRADGDRLLYRPVDAVTPELRAALRECKAELLALLEQQPSDRHDLSCGLDLDAALVLEARQEWIAVRLYSRRLDRELWLARDKRTAAELRTQLPGLPDVPVLTFAEVPRLAGKPTERLQAILDVLAKFPDAGWLQ